MNVCKLLLICDQVLYHEMQVDNDNVKVENFMA